MEAVACGRHAVRTRAIDFACVRVRTGIRRESIASSHYDAHSRRLHDCYVCGVDWHLHINCIPCGRSLLLFACECGWRARHRVAYAMCTRGPTAWGQSPSPDRMPTCGVAEQRASEHSVQFVRLVRSRLINSRLDCTRSIDYLLSDQTSTNQLE